MVFRKLLNRLSVRAVKERLDRRKLQHEIDTHRLFLLTRHYELRCRGYAPDVAAITAEAEGLAFEGMRDAVGAQLRQQLLHMSRAVHESLHDAGDAAGAANLVTQLDESQQAAVAREHQGEMPQAQQPRRGRGLAAAVGVPLHTPGPALSQAHSKGGGVSMHELAQAVEGRLGFALHTAPSAVEHEAAGQGLWLSGRAHPGSVVALYPGIVYPPQHYRHMPGYPRVDRNNDTLLARYDGAVIDALPWAQLQDDSSGADVVVAGSAAAMPKTADSAAAFSTGAESGGADVAISRRHALPWHSYLESRHPLALAHVANHPSPGSKPNVMVANYEGAVLQGEPAWVRAYLPNIIYEPPPDSAASSGSLFSFRTSPAKAASLRHLGIGNVRALVAGIALIATQEVHNEELLLNYRLSPHVSRPSWYTPVDDEEDRRRWD